MGFFDDLGVVNMVLVIFPFVGISMYVSLKEDMGLPVIILCTCVGIGLLIILAAGKSFNESETDDQVNGLKRQINVSSLFVYE